MKAFASGSAAQHGSGVTSASRNGCCGNSGCINAPLFPRQTAASLVVGSFDCWCGARRLVRVMFGKRPRPNDVLAERVRQLVQRKRQSDAREARTPLFRDGTLTINGGERLRVVIRDMSGSGARVAFMGHRQLPAVVTLSEITQKLRREARVVWQRDAAAGLTFIDG